MALPRRHRCRTRPRAAGLHRRDLRQAPGLDRPVRDPVVHAEQVHRASCGTRTGTQSTDTIRHPLVNEIDLTVRHGPGRHRQEAPGRHRRRQRWTRRAGRVPDPDPPQPDAQEATPTTRSARPPATRRSPPSVIPNVALPPGDLLREEQGRPAARYGGAVGRRHRRSVAPPGIPGYTAASTRTRRAPTTPVTTPRPRRSSRRAASRTASAPSSPTRRRAEPPPAFAVEQAALAKVGIKVTAATSTPRRTTAPSSARRRTSRTRASASPSPAGVPTSRPASASSSPSPTAARSCRPVTGTTRA